jgi:hypothetical protein
MKFYNDAETNWAIDEANSLIDFALDYYESEGHDNYHQWLMRERDHMFINVFNRDHELMNQFSEVFNKNTAKVTNLYI